jgi:Anti-anti-sigma regulatory factor (antagonist of anti-sigma factor)
MTVHESELKPKSWQFEVPQQRLAWKVSFIVIVMGGMLLLTSIAAFILMQQVAQTEEERAQAQEQARIANQLRGYVQYQTSHTLDMLWSRTNHTQDLFIVDRQFREDIELARNFPGVGEEELQLLDDLAKQQAEYKSISDQMISASTSGRDTDAAALWVVGKEMAARTYDLADRYYVLQKNKAEAARQMTLQRRATGTIFLGISVVIALALGIMISSIISRPITRTLNQLTVAAQELATGKLSPVEVNSNDELGVLARAFNSMAAELSAQHEAQKNWNLELEQQVTARTQELQEALNRQQNLLQTIRDMSTPVLPVLNGVLVMPLIGVLDTKRMEQVQHTIMHSLSEYHAHTIILDVTGLPLIDTSVAKQLIVGMQQARLLGAQSIVVGITPEVAHTLVQLGIDFGSFRTLIDLQSALLTVIKERGIDVNKAA